MIKKKKKNQNRLIEAWHTPCLNALMNEHRNLEQ